MYACIYVCIVCIWMDWCIFVLYCIIYYTDKSIHRYIHITVHRDKNINSQPH